MGFTRYANNLVADACSSANSDLSRVAGKTFLSSTMFDLRCPWLCRTQNMAQLLSSSFMDAQRDVGILQFFLAGLFQSFCLCSPWCWWYYYNTFSYSCSPLFFSVSSCLLLLFSFPSLFHLEVFWSVDWLPSFFLSLHHLLVSLHSVRDDFKSKLLRVTRSS